MSQNKKRKKFVLVKKTKLARPNTTLQLAAANAVIQCMIQNQQFTNREFWFIILFGQRLRMCYRWKSDILINKLRVTILASCIYWASHKLWLTLLHELWVAFCTSNELLFTYKLRVTVYYSSNKILLLNKLIGTFCMRVTSCN